MNTKIKYLTRKECETLFTCIKKEDYCNGIRNYAIFLTAKYFALRASEVGLLKISDYDPFLSHLYCRRLKGSNSNTIRIFSKEVKNALDHYIEMRKNINVDSDSLFISQKGNSISRKTLDYLIKKYGTQISLPKDKCHFHVLKHTRAIELGNLGLDLKDVQWWLGHKSIENTQIYMQFTTYQQEALYRKLIDNMEELWKPNE